MKKYLFLMLAFAGALTFTSCGDDDEISSKEEQKAEYLEKKADIEANLKGSKWGYEYENGNGTITSTSSGTRTYTEAKRVTYTFNADGKSGNYSCYIKRVYDNDPSNPVITESDYDFTYEIDSNYKEFFKEYENNIKGVYTKINKGNDPYIEVGKTFYKKIEWMTRTKAMFDMEEVTRQ